MRSSVGGPTPVGAARGQLATSSPETKAVRHGPCMKIARWTLTSTSARAGVRDTGAALAMAGSMTVAIRHW
jgi:hypothetical protein